jgi:hypothetical protein
MNIEFVCGEVGCAALGMVFIAAILSTLHAGVRQLSVEALAL